MEVCGHYPFSHNSLLFNLKTQTQVCIECNLCPSLTIHVFVSVQLPVPVCWAG